MRGGLSSRALGFAAVVLVAVLCLAAGSWAWVWQAKTQVGPVRLVYHTWDEDVASLRFGLESGLSRLGSFATSLEGSRVVLVDDHDALQEALGVDLCPLTVAVASDDRHVLVQRPSSWPLELRQTLEPPRLLAHELTHLAVTRESGGRAPLWLQEGIAAYVAGDYDASLLDLCDLERVTLGAVEARLACPQPEATAGALAYQLAAGAVWCLVDELGSEAGLHRVLCHLRDGCTVEQSLQAELGYGLNEFERRLRLALAGNALQAMSVDDDTRRVEKAASAR